MSEDPSNLTSLKTNSVVGHCCDMTAVSPNTTPTLGMQHGGFAAGSRYGIVPDGPASWTIAHGNRCAASIVCSATRGRLVTGKLPRMRHFQNEMAAPFRVPRTSPSRRRRVCLVHAPFTTGHGTSWPSSCWKQHMTPGFREPLSWRFFRGN